MQLTAIAILFLIELFCLPVCEQEGLQGAPAHTATEIVRPQSKAKPQLRTGWSKDLIRRKLNM